MGPVGFEFLVAIFPGKTRMSVQTLLLNFAVNERRMSMIGVFVWAVCLFGRFLVGMPICLLVSLSVHPSLAKNRQRRVVHLSNQYIFQSKLSFT